jgi:hypothetical protein
VNPGSDHQLIYSSLCEYPLSLSVLLALVLVSSIAVAQAGEGSDDLETQIGLADLAAYHSALKGSATAHDARSSEPPRPVSFRELWDHAKEWQGRRVVVTGRVARIFRQGAVGDFPPLTQLWISTPRGDVLCLVFPVAENEAKTRSLEPGERIKFTGTFLKTIRYPASDQARLAPLVVGSRQPDRASPSAEQEPVTARVPRTLGNSQVPNNEVVQGLDSWFWGSWWIGLGLGLVVVGVLAWQHIHAPALAGRAAGGDAALGTDSTDRLLEFIDRSP